MFDASHADETSTYAIYSIDPEASERFKQGEWDVLRPSLTPTGEVPATDVEFDVATGIRVRTYGIEQFATA